MRGGRRNFKDRDQINKITAGSPECFSAMRCILDRRLLIAPPERYPSPPKRFWWGRRGFAPPVLEVEAVRIFDWLSPDHEFPVGRMDPRNVRILERALQNSRIWVIRGIYPCAISRECPRPVSCIIDGRKWTLGYTSIVVVDDEGRPWVAPNLVLHYVVEHGYDPGFKFRDAPEALVNFLRSRTPEPILDSSSPI